MREDIQGRQPPNPYNPHERSNTVEQYIFGNTPISTSFSEWIISRTGRQIME